MGKIMNYPKRILYIIKEAEGDKIVTKDSTYTWTNLAGKKLDYITYISTDDKKTFYYNYRAKDSPTIKFSNCKKIN